MPMLQCCNMLHHDMLMESYSRPHAVTLTCTNRWIPMDSDGFRWILVMPLLPNADSSCCGRSTGLSWTLPPSSRGKHAGVVPREPFWRIETYPFFGELEPRSILDHCICWMIKANSCPPRVVGGRQGEHRLESPGMPWLLHFMETYGNLF